MKADRWVRSSAPFRRVVRRLRPSPLAVCEYNAWDRYTIEELFPDALRIALRPGEDGHRVVSALSRNTRAVLMHINLSRTAGIIAGVDEFQTSLRDRGVVLLNGDATDISKRTIQDRCAAVGLPTARAAREGAGDERLILKTNLNYGGVPELDLIRDLGRRASRFAGVFGAAGIASPPYRIYYRRDVPPAFWDDPAVVLERFIENREGIFFRVYVVGPATCASEVWSDDDIKKLSLPVRARVNHFFWTSAGEHVAAGATTDIVARVVTLTRQVFDAMRTDFGAGDCVMGDDGEIVVVDVNKTPYWGSDVWPDIVSHLRRGLDHVIANGS